MPCVQEFQGISNIGEVKTLLAVVKKRVALQTTCQENIKASHHGKPADMYMYIIITLYTCVCRILYLYIG